MRIAIDVNGVLRDTLTKIQQVYERWYIDNQIKQTDDDDFQYEIISDVTTLDLANHLKFKDEDEIYNFLYVDHTMEIFGHSPSVEMNTFVDLNDFYFDKRDEHEILIVSDEIAKSKPATLFFISKFGCQLEKVKFYSKVTMDNLWEELDILVTANPELIINHPKDKKIIKFNTTYNTNIDCETSISTIKELKEIKF
jgi:hypothetical protein